MSDWKTTCPSCDSWTSSIGQAAHDGEPCPYCGASLPPFAPWDEHCAQCQFLVARDAARGIATELEQRLTAIRALHQCGEVGNAFGGYNCAECDQPWLTTLGGCPTAIAAAGGGLGV